MEENKNNKSEIKTMIALVVLVAALIVGVKVIFAGLEKVMPPLSVPAQSEQADSSVQSRDEAAPAPNFCPHCGDELPGSFQWEQFCPYCGEKVALE